MEITHTGRGMMLPRWTKEAADILTAMYRAEKPYKEIADVLGYSVPAVQGKAQRLGLADRKQPSQHRNPLFVKMREERRTTAEIMAVFGVPKKKVQQWIHEAINEGLTVRISPPVFWTAERDAELTRLWRIGYGPSCIGPMMGRTPNSVSIRAKKIGLPARAYPKVRKAAPPRDYKADHLRLVARAPRPKVTDTLWDKTETSRPWLERASGECAFPLGDRGDIHSCCAPVLHNDTYCEHHRIVAGGLRIPGASFQRAPMRRAA